MFALRRPASLKSANAKYKAELAAEAQGEMGEQTPFQGRLFARIIWFHAEQTTQDADNIVKPILDSLKGVVFEDDSQVGEFYVARIDLAQPYTLDGLQEEIFARLLELLTRQERHIVYIEVGASPD